MLLHSLGLRRCKTLSCGLINQNLKLLLELSSAKKSPTHKTKMYFYWNSISFRKGKKKKKKEEGGKKKGKTSLPSVLFESTAQEVRGANTQFGKCRRT